MDPSEKSDSSNQWDNSKNNSSQSSTQWWESSVDGGQFAATSAPGAAPGTGGASSGRAPAMKVLAAIAAVLLLILLMGISWYVGKSIAMSDDQRAAQSSSSKPSGLVQKYRKDEITVMESAPSPTAGSSKSNSVSTPTKGMTKTKETTAATKDAKRSSNGRCGQAEIETGFRSPVSVFCDEDWALIGDGIEDFRLYHWKGNSWRGYKYDGEHWTGIPCYWRDGLEESKAPSELLEYMEGKGLLCVASSKPLFEDFDTDSSSSAVSSSDSDSEEESVGE